MHVYFGRRRISLAGDWYDFRSGDWYDFRSGEQASSSFSHQ
jgi:hypothetical protein